MAEWLNAAVLKTADRVSRSGGSNPSPSATAVIATVTRVAPWENPKEALNEMSITDKVTGKVKQAVGDITGDSKTRREGIDEERKGEKKEELHNAEAKADRKADEVADLERRT